MKKETCKKHGRDCYAASLNKSAGKPVFSMDVCAKCDAHLSPSGICLNACHLSKESLERFNSLMAAAQKSVGSRKK